MNSIPPASPLSPSPSHYSMNLFVGLVIIALSHSRMLRDITQIAAPVATGTDANGLPVVLVNQPTGNTAPPAMTTPSPYSTYSAAWQNNMTMRWVPDASAFSFDTANIANLQLDNLGPNFAVLRTAGIPNR